MDLATVDELLTTTRMVRKRLDLERPVPPSVLQECLRLAAQAPIGAGAGGDLNRWRWIVVTDPDLRNRLGDLYRAAGADAVEAVKRSGKGGSQNPLPPRTLESAMHLAQHIQDVPAIVIPCVENYADDSASDRWGSYIYPAVWSFILALRSRGLATCITTLHLYRADEAAKLLGIPEGYQQACLLPVGYYTGTTFQPAKRQPIEELTYWDHWGSTKL